jgi:hypothetical protein
MKLSGWFVVLASTAVLTGCDNATAPSEGQLVARWSGMAWIGTAGAMLKSTSAGDTVYVYANGSTTGVRREQSISVSSAITGIGTYHLGPYAAAFYETVGGDVLTANYSTTKDATGTLKITRFDGVGGTIEGSISFDAVSDGRVPPYGSRASFENGRFSTTLRDFPQR